MGYKRISLTIDLVSCAKNLNLVLLKDKTHKNKNNEFCLYVQVDDNDTRGDEELERDIRILKLLFAILNHCSPDIVHCMYK